MFREKYENGVVRLLEEVPEVSSKKVLITFLEEVGNDNSFSRQASLQQPKEFVRSDLADDREDLYQEFLNKENDNR